MLQSREDFRRATWHSSPEPWLYAWQLQVQKSLSLYRRGSFFLVGVNFDWVVTVARGETRACGFLVEQALAGLDCYGDVGKISRARSGTVIEKQSFVPFSRTVGKLHTRSI